MFLTVATFKKYLMLSHQHINSDEQSKKSKQLSRDKDDLRFSVKLPKFHYKLSSLKIHSIALDTTRTNGNKFNNLEDALLYIQGHCMFHHGRFSRNLARKYLEQCAVYEPTIDLYIMQIDVNRKEFEKIYKKICKG